MVAQEAVISEAAALRKLIERQGEQLLEEAIAELLRAGDISRHIKKSHKIYLQRLDNTCRLLREAGPCFIRSLNSAHFCDTP